MGPNIASVCARLAAISRSIASLFSNRARSFDSGDIAARRSRLDASEPSAKSKGAKNCLLYFSASFSRPKEMSAPVPVPKI